jgi:hypothetical protein
LQQAGIISTKKSKRGNVPFKVADNNSIAGLTPKQTTEDDPIDKTLDDPIDKAGHAVMTVLKKAAGISNEAYERATALSDDLANKLRTTERGSRNSKRKPPVSGIGRPAQKNGCNKSHTR